MRKSCRKLCNAKNYPLEVRKCGLKDVFYLTPSLCTGRHLSQGHQQTAKFRNAHITNTSSVGQTNALHFAETIALVWANLEPLVK